MTAQSLLPTGDFRTTYAADTTIFPTATSHNVAIASIGLVALAPLVLSQYWLSILIQIGYLGIAALGLNILVGFTGQISIGHAAFFGLGAFTSAYLSTKLPIPVFFAIPLAAVVTAAVGLMFGLPAARLKGLYLAIATLAAQYILLDFFSRAEWFTGGVVPASAAPFTVFGYAVRGDRQYFYVVLAYTVACYLLVTNLMRTRDGRALIAVRDHYLSAEIMGINLTRYRTLSFGLAAFFAGIGGALYAHYQEVVSNEGFGIDRSILFLSMVIIGGLGSIMGTLLGTAFMVLLPETMEALSALLRGSAIDQALALKNNIAFVREIAIGLVIVLFLIFFQVMEGRRIIADMTIRENLRLGAFTRSDGEVAGDLDRVLDYFPRLKERTCLAGYLSGGEQQMLAIGRALMARPKLILMDEPSMGLSPLLVKEVFSIIRRINRDLGVTVLLVEQNARAALAIASYGYIMEQGKVVLDGTADALRSNEDVKEFYLGGAGEARKSFKNLKSFRRRKRWL